MNRAEVLKVLELTASGRPGLLPPLAKALRVAGVVAQVAESWGVTVEDLATVARAAAERLDGLERRRGRWDVEGLPHARAVRDLAIARAGRVSMTHRQRLERITRKLDDVADLERIRADLEAFLSESGEPVELSRYMPHA